MKKGELEESQHQVRPLPQIENPPDSNPEEEEKEEELETASFCSLFRFATTTDIILIIFGSICAAAMGVALPAFAILWGNMTDKFQTSADMEKASRDIMIQFIYIGCGALGAGWAMFSCWMIAGERQGIACRKEYLRSLLRQ